MIAADGVPVEDHVGHVAKLTCHLQQKKYKQKMEEVYLVVEWCSRIFFHNPSGDEEVDHFKAKNKGDWDALLQYHDPFKRVSEPIANVDDHAY